MATETEPKRVYEGVINPHDEENLRLMIAHLKQFSTLAGMRNEKVVVKIWFEKSQPKVKKEKER